MLNTLGALFYLAIAGLALFAALRTRRSSRRHWLMLALFFVALFVWRFFEGEATLQDHFRQLARESGIYVARHAWQAPLLVAGIATGSGLLALVWFRGRRTFIYRSSRLAAATLAIYSILRAVSLHAFDALIYFGFGRFHINHAIDLGLAAICGLCAFHAATQKNSRNALID